MGDNIYLGDRNGVRTPMQWSPDRNAGFSRADPQRLYLPPIMDPIYGYEAVNVEAQLREPVVAAQLDAPHARGAQGASRVRPRHAHVPAARQPQDPRLPARATATRSCCASRTSRAPRSRSSSTSSRFKGRVPVELLGRTPFPPIGELPYLLTLPGHGFLWFRLATGEDAAGVARGAAAARRPAGAGAVRRLGEPVPRPRRAVAHRDGGEGPHAARARGAAGVHRRRGAGSPARARACGASSSPTTSSGSTARGSWLVALTRVESADGETQTLFPAADARLGGSRRRDAARRSAR